MNTLVGAVGEKVAHKTREMERTGKLTKKDSREILNVFRGSWNNCASVPLAGVLPQGLEP